MNYRIRVENRYNSIPISQSDAQDLKDVLRDAFPELTIEVYSDNDTWGSVRVRLPGDTLSIDHVGQIRQVDIRRDDHEPVTSNQAERDNPTPAAIKEEIDRNYREEIYGQDDYDPNNDPWPGGGK